jgi:hypothetical protein
MAHFRAWVKWSGTTTPNDDEAMRLACHHALDDLLRDMKRKRVDPVADRDGKRKLELIINAGEK